MLKGIKLSFYTEEEIQKLCVVKVNNAATYDRGVPRIEGINDPRLGVSHQTTKCPTCSLVNCDQHLGYVELATPVYRLGTINYVLQILRCVCRECARPKFHDGDVAPLRTYTPKDRLRALSETCRNRFVCPHCKAIQPMYVRRDRIILDITYRPKDLATVQDAKYRAFLTAQFTPEEARAILEGMTMETKAVLSLTNPEDMVVRLQIVPPPIIRPSNFVGETKVRSENDLTLAIQDIVRASIETETDPAQWVKLQVMQASLVNHTIKKTVGVKMGVVPSLVASNKRKINDLKTRLSGKKGRFRGNLAGKRVDQSGRSVIGPDSSHDITELGVPSHVMNTLTFPERVTTLNMAKLARCVTIGPYKDGGAMAVKQPHALPDALIWLPVLDNDGRADLAAQLAVGWIVERHLVNGDWALFNRQPSLWKASMMAFTIYRVPTLCFRLPLPVTKPFNADFDGDEMNFHSLQDHSAIAEAQELLSVPHQMMNPQSNSVIIGLVQDSLVGGFRMTKMDTFLTISDMFQIAMCRHYNPESENFKDMGGKDTLTPVIEEPAIIKSPKGPLYTGKQVVSFLLPDISLVKGVRTENLWNDDYVIIRNGCLLTGQLCKSTLGATNHGIIQAVFGKFGEWAACKFVSDAQRTFVTFLATHGPSISMLDCMVETPKDIIQSSLDKAAQIINLDLPYEVIEVKSSSVLQETLRNVGGTVANALETNTGLYTVVTSGSKGNLMNIAQIAGCVGQQTVFGRRVPMRASVTGKRTLAYFAPDDTTPQSRGFIARSYREGLRPEEFFYHQMAGREGIVATAVNTADSGYNQRRMIKSQESQCVAYDGTVRVCADNIVQISYGYDDMDGASVCRFRLSADVVHKAMSAAGIVKDCADFLGRVLQMRTILLKDLDTTVVCPIGADAFVDGQPPDLETLYAELIACHATLHRKPTWRMTIPAAVAIIMFWQRPGQTVPDVVRRYQCGLIQPGEGVGAIAATSIGEPSMQMTLNVFHYTGIASKNVTITGLPRFRQLINAVDSYETSNMTAEVTSFEEAPKNIGAVTLGEIADIEVDETKKHEFLTSFIGLQAGALVAKVQKKKVAVSKSPWCVVARIRWNAAEQHKLRTNEIATALRRVLGLEAIVVCPPYWAPEPFLVIIPVWVHGAVSARQWVESIAENLSNVVVSGIPGIKRSLVLQEPRWNTKLQKSSVFVIDTEGSSLVEFVKLPGIRRSSAVTNNVVEIARTIGITAGVLVLQAELHKVLSFDSSYVDPRHTWLLADTMCRAGSVCATNRHNMQSLGNSVLQRASFEQSLEVFHEGAVFGMYDPLTGSTERIMVGQPAKVGTGMVSVVTQATVEQPEATIVAPLHPKATKTSQDEELGENFVRPLRHNETFCLENHGVRVTEESKDGDNRLSDLFAHWRSHAGAFREAAQVTATQTVSANQLDAIMLECKTCGTWAQTQQNATTRVYYGSTTTIVDNAFSALHITRKVLSRHTYENVLWEVFAERKVTDLPTSIVPDRVEIVHSADFIKNGFVLQARKTFSGVTNMEAEASVAANMCVCTLQVSMASSESMLQVRATNGQFANAYANRLS